MPSIETAAELTPHQELACAYRVLAAEGFTENFTGHISWQLPGEDTMLCNPQSRWWSEMRASDISRVTLDGEVVDGAAVSDAVFIHTELHRARPDARVVVHNHPHHAKLLAGIGELPRIFHQAGALFDGDLVLVDEYRGAVNSSAEGAHLADLVGKATGAILVNHGVLVTGETVAEAVYRSVTLLEMCQLTYEVLLLDREPREIPAEIRADLKAWCLRYGSDEYWNGAARQLVAREPEVLT